MIKYRVYDTKQNMYLNGEDVDINGYGDLTAYGADEDGSHVTQLLNTRSPRFIVEQYTGLKDKNGTEIASGDIVKRRTANYEKQVFEDEYGVVKYEKGSFYVDFRGDIDNLMLRYGEPEVIGNIHDNGELLEESK